MEAEVEVEVEVEAEAEVEGVVCSGRLVVVGMVGCAGCSVVV